MTIDVDHPQPRHAGKLRVGTGLLAVALHLPTGTEIVAVEPEVWRGSITLIVEHPHLPEIPEGGTIPDVDLTTAVIISEWSIPDQDEETPDVSM